MVMQTPNFVSLTLMTKRLSAVLFVMVIAMPLTQAATSCSAESGDVRVPLLELYTSEGCDSCPPTDRWVSNLLQRGYAPQRALVLAWHVDYWDRLGWPDQYAQARFSARQRDANHRNGARFVYTPQLLLDGADYRRGTFRDDFGDRVAALSQQKPGAHIRLTLMPTAEGAQLQADIKAVESASRKNAATYIALYENALTNDVKAGENRGKKLLHDFVVRELWGPFATGPTARGSITQRIPLLPGWKAANLHVAAFVQDATTGRTLQTLSLPYCPTATSEVKKDRP